MDSPLEYLPLIALVGAFVTIIVGIILLKGLKDEFSNPEVRRIRLAAATLTGIVLVFIYAMSIYAAKGTPSASGSPDSAGRDIFDACVQILPPLVTLIVGYWLGAQNGQLSFPTKEPDTAKVSPGDV